MLIQLIILPILIQEFSINQIIVEKIRILTKENAKQQMPQNETPINEDKKLEIK